MIDPILSAISPEVPVSISSKITVGRAVAPAIIDFRQSIKREISPPDATWATGINGLFLLAEKRKLTESFPVMSGLLFEVTSVSYTHLDVYKRQHERAW